METFIETTRRGHTYPYQIFNGKKYHKYSHERYFSRHDVRLHRAVWEYYNGPIPEGYDVHHKDGNAENNDISNLEVISTTEHAKLHAEQHRNDPECMAKLRANMAKANKAACEWHRSPEGREWHRKHAREQGPRKEYERTCICCGKTYTTKNPNSKFCSLKCNAKNRRDSGVDNITKVCPVCGKEFSTNRYSGTNACSKSCGAKYQWALRRQAGGGAYLKKWD